MVCAVYSKLAAQHRNPVPNAAILRGLLVTSGILGKRLDTDDYPADRGEQTALVFSYLEAILEEAGATPQDVIVVLLRRFTNLADATTLLPLASMTPPSSPSVFSHICRTAPSSSSDISPICKTAPSSSSEISPIYTTAPSSS